MELSQTQTQELNNVLMTDTVRKLDKGYIRRITDVLAQLIASGELSALDALIYAKKQGELAKAIETYARPIAEGEYNISEKGYTLHNVKIDQAETGVKYDYAECGDVVYNELAAEMEALKEAVKERETFLKAIKTPATFVDERTGEAYTITPPVKRAHLGLKLSIV